MSLIAISPGDPAGIGPEVCLKALSKNKKHYKLNFSTPNILKFNEDKIKRFLNENEKNEKVIISTDYPSRVKEILGLNNVEIFDITFNVRNI